MNLSELYEQRKDLQFRLDDIQRNIKVEESRIRKSVGITKRNASVILTREDGVEIVVQTVSNTYGEKKVYEYTGTKRGEFIGTTRQGLNDIRLSFGLNMKIN